VAVVLVEQMAVQQAQALLALEAITVVVVVVEEMAEHLDMVVLAQFALFGPATLVHSLQQTQEIYKWNFLFAL
jgi:hypothetical protein